MNRTQKVCHDSLSDKIAKCRLILQTAENCLKDNDYLQCAAHLEEVGKEIHFDEFVMNIFDAMGVTAALNGVPSYTSRF